MSPKPCYCINPNCKQPDHPQNNDPNTRYCLSCGSELLLNGRFRVSRLLSDDSGFGNVYEAFQGFSASILKVLKPQWNSQPKAIELFKREYEVLAQLTQQGITAIPQALDYFEYQTRDGLILYCLVMEKVEGIDLIQWLKNNGKINQKQALKWLREIVTILDKVHSLNYFHRDLKPHNIMMRNNGELVLIDFGTAREETQTYYQKVQGQRVTGISSAGYTPIEQQNGQAVMQSDFYALGRTFVHLLTGKYPLDPIMYDGNKDILNWRDYTENINPLLLDLIDHLMARLADNRPQNIKVILQLLDDIEQNLKQPQKFINPTQPSSPPQRQKSSYTLQKRSENNVIKNSLIVVGSISFLGLVFSLRPPAPVVTPNQPTSTPIPTNIPTQTPISETQPTPIETKTPETTDTPSPILTPSINKFSSLESYLKQENWKQADLETLSLIFQAESINNFSCSDIRQIDQLWLKYSYGKFGLSVQKPIYFETGNTPGINNQDAWRRFADRVGWIVNGVWLESYNVLNLSLNAPQGHLPAFAGQKGSVNRSIIDRSISCGF